MTRLFRAIRKYQVVEEVEVFAEHEQEAREKIEDDTEDVIITGSTDGDYEIEPGPNGFFEVKE